MTNLIHFHLHVFCFHKLKLMTFFRLTYIINFIFFPKIVIISKLYIYTYEIHKKIDSKSHHNIYDNNTFTTIKMLSVLEMLEMLFGRGGREIYDKAFKLASGGVRSGCNDSKALLATCYYYGCGCQKNVDEASRLAKESAEQGNKYGHLILGRILYWKSDCSFRPDAINHYMIAAELGLTEALLTIGSMYMNGMCLKMDKKKGLDLMMQAADQKHGPAYKQIGRCHEFGEGVPVNKSEARKWYQMAVDAGDASAQNSVDRLDEQRK